MKNARDRVCVGLKLTKNYTRHKARGRIGLLPTHLIYSAWNLINHSLSYTLLCCFVTFWFYCLHRIMEKALFVHHEMQKWEFIS